MIPQLKTIICLVMIYSGCPSCFWPFGLLDPEPWRSWSLLMWTMGQCSLTSATLRREKQSAISKTIRQLLVTSKEVWSGWWLHKYSLYPAWDGPQLTCPTQNRHGFADGLLYVFHMYDIYENIFIPYIHQYIHCLFVCSFLGFHGFLMWWSTSWRCCYGKGSYLLTFWCTDRTFA